MAPGLSGKPKTVTVICHACCKRQLERADMKPHPIENFSCKIQPIVVMTTEACYELVKHLRAIGRRKTEGMIHK